MHRQRWWWFLAAAAIVGMIAFRESAPRVQADQAPARPSGADGRAGEPDSYFYYGPNGLWKYWHDPANPQASIERLGRDTWIHWTWGNQKFLRKASVLAGNLTVPVSVDFFRLLDSRRRGTRFRDFGLINEPNCVVTSQPDQYGLYLDHWNGDPLGYYPMSPEYRERYDPRKDVKELREKYPVAYAGGGGLDTRHYGRPSGVIGLRLFDNPKFDKAKWSRDDYFQNPGKVEPPYLVGFTCGFCHMTFNPLNPPRDPENPRWENLAANLGNQYFREGELMLGKGRIVFGDKHPNAADPLDPYKTSGLTEADFLYHYAVTQQPGTSETSRITYDFINNPNTINPIYNLRHRPTFGEAAPNGQKRTVMHILKDGADSVGIEWALMRVPINIGCEGEYWVDHLFDPVTGRRQRPFRIAEVLATLPAADRQKLEAKYQFDFKDISAERLQELKVKYRSAYGKEEFGQDWQEAWRRNGNLAAYLMSYGPSSLRDAAKAGNPADAQAAAAALPDEEARLRGAALFDRHCAGCHNSKKSTSARDKDFLTDNFLSDDVRYPVTTLGTNMARALATNAVDHDIWAEFSSKDYKALPPVGRVHWEVPVFPANAPLPASVKRPIPIDFEPPGGGRGYYRTPSLISMWATAPYFHNNALGDYYVIRDDGSKGWFPNDGQRIGRRLPDGTWVDFRIDVSVDGRLKMFEDGVDKLLNPWKRRRWVKRTSAESTLVPDLENSARQLILAVARDEVRRELTRWLEAQQVPPGLIDKALQAVDKVFAKAAPAVFQDGQAALRLGWAALYARLRDHAERLFDQGFEDLKPYLAAELGGRALPLDKLKPNLRQAYLARLDGLDRQLREGSVLKIPAGTPVNLYANLNSSALMYAALAHVRHRDDPRALAEALLQLSDCPDLVEDAGHLFGTDLTDQEKKDLIAFLKTL